MVDGKKVVSDIPAPSPLPTRAGHQQITFKNLRVLELEDGSHTFGCGECQFTGARGAVQRHRYEDHQVPKPGGGRRAVEPPLPQDLSGMTLGELVELSRDAAAWGELVAELEVRLDDWRTRALRAEAWKRKAVTRFSQIGFTLSDEDED